MVQSTAHATLRLRSIVTGGASGIGREIAIQMSRRGDRVALVDRDTAGMATTVAHMVGSDHLALELDVTDPASVDSVVERAARALGAFDALVNAAGVAVRGRIETIDLDSVHRMLAVNVLGTYLMIRSSLPHFGETSSVVNLASAASVRGAPYLAAYAATKGAVDGLTRSLAVELADRNIRVNCVSPGAVDTPMLARLDPPADADEGALMQSRPLNGRTASVTDVASAVLFLTDRSQGHITGFNLVVDGGASC